MIRANSRPAWAEIDAGALISNTVLMKEMVHPAKLCAVVKADGYGHGASLVATVLEKGGIADFAVATVDEGLELREAGIPGRILCLSEPPRQAIRSALVHGITLSLYTKSAIAQLASEASSLYENGMIATEDPGYHMKVDTGMHRVGLDPGDVIETAEFARSRGIGMTGFWTHMAVADELPSVGRGFTERQLEIFDAARFELASRGFRPLLHAANSASAFNYPQSRYDMVRSGIALYGYSPSKRTQIAGLVPSLSLKARVAFVRKVGPGERPSYGRLKETKGDCTVLATVPLGYADGIARTLFDAGAEVLIRGRRRPLAGMVTMDQIVVDCGDDPEVALGDEVVLLGSQGSETISVDDWAAMLGTISYEVVTRIGYRVPRILRGEGGVPAEGE